MNKNRMLWVVLGIILVLWIAAGITDFTLVGRGGKPVFCVETRSEHYTGLGYSFDVTYHPMTGTNSHKMYILGIDLEDFQNNVNELNNPTASYE